MRHLFVVPIDRVGTNTTESADGGDLSLYYELTSAIATVKGKVSGGRLEVGARDGAIVAAAKSAGRQHVNVWVSAGDAVALRDLGEDVVEVQRDSLEAEAYAPSVVERHLLVLEKASPHQADALRPIVSQLFKDVQSFDVSERDGALVVLFVAEAPVGDPTWLPRWLAELRDVAEDEGFSIRSYQGRPFLPTPS